IGFVHGRGASLCADRRVAEFGKFIEFVRGRPLRSQYCGFRLEQSPHAVRVLNFSDIGGLHEGASPGNDYDKSFAAEGVHRLTDGRAAHAVPLSEGAVHDDLTWPKLALQD